MTRLTLPITSLATLVICAFYAVPAQAQTRVFVAAQGSDSNPCTFAAPCRTFQHAHNVVAASGEIDVLDPAGYGAVTITKSISIQGHGFSGISPASSTTAITIAAGATDIVNLSGLLIDGGSIGLHGILFTTGYALTIEDSIVRNLTSDGIQFFPSATSRLSVTRSIISSNAGNGVLVQPTGSGVATVVFDHVHTEYNGSNGLYVNDQVSTGGSVYGSVTDSVSSHNGTGYRAARFNGTLMLVRSLAASNVTGIFAVGTINISQMTIVNNITDCNGGGIFSYGDNIVDQSCSVFANQKL
jgi:hypothetical protein